MYVPYGEKVSPFYIFPYGYKKVQTVQLQRRRITCNVFKSSLWKSHIRKMCGKVLVLFENISG